MTLLNRSSIVACIVTCFAPAMGQEASKNEQGDVILPPITVVGFKNLSGDIVLENDGSFTATSQTKYMGMAKLLSSPGARVNLDIYYAPRSTNLTAEGQQVVANLSDSIRYMNEGTVIKITPTEVSSKADSRRMSKRRLESLKAKLANTKNRNVTFSFGSFRKIKSQNRSRNLMEGWRVIVENVSPRAITSK